MNRITTLLATLAIGGCAGQQTVPPAQGMFVGESVQEVTGKLAGLCMSYGYEVLETSIAHVLCQKSATPTEDMLYRSMLVGASATPTVKKLRFSMAGLPEGVRVMGTLNFEATKAFGQTHQMAATDAETANQIRAALVSAGAL